MRRVICALALLMSSAPAFAGDFDVLRGSESVGPARFTNWSGFYFGGQVGYSNVNTDFSKATSSLVSFSLRELALEAEDNVSSWPVLGQGNNSTTTFGGFIGYSTQWQDLILSIEGDYSRVNVTTTAAELPISRRTSAGGNTYDVTVLGSASLHLTDYGSLRARAGWIFDNYFLPYGFVGVAIGRSDYTRASLVYGQENPGSPPVVPCDNVATPSCVDFSYFNSDGNSAVMYGFTVGGGLDVALTSNIFLRGEFEYVRFAPLADMTVSVMSGRVGAGIKF